jgi:hypothetical protein
MVGGSVDALGESVVLDPHAEPFGYPDEWRRVLRLVDRKVLAIRILEPEDRDGHESHEDVRELLGSLCMLIRDLSLDSLPHRSEDIERLPSLADGPPDLLPLTKPSRVVRPGEKHQELVPEAPPG